MKCHCGVPLYDADTHDAATILLIKSGEAEEVAGRDADGEALCPECAAHPPAARQCEWAG